MWPTGQDLFVHILVKIKMQYNHPRVSYGTACLSMTKWDYSGRKLELLQVKLVIYFRKFLFNECKV